MAHANNRGKYYFGINDLRTRKLMGVRNSLETYFQDGSIHCLRARALMSAKRDAARQPRKIWTPSATIVGARFKFN